MISQSIEVIYGVEPPRNSAASPSSVRHPYLTFISSRTHLRFNPFGALGGKTTLLSVVGGKVSLYMTRIILWLINPCLRKR